MTINTVSLLISSFASSTLMLLCMSGYLAFILWPILSLSDSSADCDQSYTRWILKTNIIALFASVMIWKLEKGTLGSVVGIFCYLINFFSMVNLVMQS